MRSLLVAAGFMVFAGCVNSALSDHSVINVQDETASIEAVLLTQKVAWNAGDIDGFMEGYLREPSLRFASGGNVTKGWQQTLDRYKANYSDRAKMGVLDFTDIEISQLSGDAAVVHGRWKLERASDAPHGLFTLVFRKIDGQWLIVSDTTTSGGS